MVGARPVSGGVGAGCGAFSLVGLLIGVGLTVWLGSIVVGGIGGSGRDTNRNSNRSAPAGGANVEVQPPGSLADGTEAQIHGTGFIAGSTVRVSVCLPQDRRAQRRCADAGAKVATADALGEFDATLTVRSRITVAAKTVDCGHLGACLVVARSTSGPDRVGTASLRVGPSRSTDPAAPTSTGGS